MKIHQETLSSTERFIEKHRHVTLEDREDLFRREMRLIRRFVNVDEGTRILEIGTGIGWFPILCKRNGIACDGLEIRPSLVEFAENLGKKYGIQPDIKLGNIEDADIGQERYDVIVANSVFEHIEDWQGALKRVIDALKTGGLFYFYSTNKFSFVSGEFRFPLYGWLPNKWRYRLRVARQGEDIMKSGIDFNQFTYIGLRRFFKDIGFSIVMDPIQMHDAEHLNNPKLWKKAALQLLKRRTSKGSRVDLRTGNTIYMYPVVILFNAY